MLPRSITWDDHAGAVVIVDQTKLPHRVEHLTLRTVDELVGAIQRLSVRGAPALGVAGVLGVALALVEAERNGWSGSERDAAIERVRRARPTAVNLPWGVAIGVEAAAGGVPAVVARAQELIARDEATNRAMSERAAAVLACADRPVRLLTHCNTGALACAAWGTAIGTLRHLHEAGQLDVVYVDETRPLLQGARLTAWELGLLGVEHRLVVDAAAPWLMRQGLVDGVVVGADRVTRCGDVANKIGTYGLAVAAAHHGVPFVVVAPESTVDPNLESGADIVIEDRPADEVRAFGGAPVAPLDTPVINPGFDVTPAALITAIVTERRVVRPAMGERVDAPLAAATGA